MDHGHFVSLSTDLVTPSKTKIQQSDERILLNAQTFISTNILPYNYCYYICLMAFFQDNLGKLAPES